MSKDDKKGKNNKKSGLGLAIWILAFLIILIVFLVKSEDIKTNLQKTRFFDRIFGKTPTFITEHKPEPKKEVSESDTVIEIKKPEKKEKPKSQPVTEKTETNPAVQQPKVEEKKQEVKPVQKSEPVVESKKEETKPVENKKTETPTKKQETVPETNKTESVKTVSKQETETPKAVKPDTLATKICFVAIDSDGPIVRKEVTRNVLKDSPLTNCVNSLLAGPSSYEKSIGCTTLIPEGTKLYAISVKNGVAVMNFSEEFEFNQYGVEGYLGQLMQIVYTATSFSTVDSVQILIEGKKKEYLGSEGVWIGSPLSRASFK